MSLLPEYSVIVPAYEARATVSEAVASALETRVRVEVIVVDDGSTQPVLQKDLPGGPVRLVRRFANGGSARARNDGIDACEGAWVAFLDADDLYAPYRLDAVDAFLRTVGVDGVMTDTWMSFDDGTRRLIRPKASLSGLLGLRCAPIFASLVVRRDVLRAVGPFDPRWAIQEDSDMWLRLLRHRARIRQLQGASYVYRVHGSSKVHRAGGQAQSKEFASIWFRQLLAPSWSLWERAILLRQGLRHARAAGGR